MQNDSAILGRLAKRRSLTLFNCGDATTGMRMPEPLHAGGVRIAELTNRSVGAPIPHADAGRFAEPTERANRLVAIPD